MRRGGRCRGLRRGGGQRGAALPTESSVVDRECATPRTRCRCPAGRGAALRLPPCPGPPERPPGEENGGDQSRKATGSEDSDRDGKFLGGRGPGDDKPVDHLIEHGLHRSEQGVVDREPEDPECSCSALATIAIFSIVAPES